MPMAFSCTKCGYAVFDLDHSCPNCGAAHSNLDLIESMAKKIGEVEDRYHTDIISLKQDLDVLRQHLASEEGLEKISNWLERAGRMEERQPIDSEVAEGEASVDASGEDGTIPEPEETFEEHQVPLEVIDGGVFSEPPTTSSAPPKRKKRVIPQLLFLVDGAEFLHSVYLKYKREKKLPIFFMTIAGGLALLYGIGFFLQYTLETTGKYAQVIKIAGGFLAALTAIAFGFKLYRRDEQYREYASSLMSLGIILNYVMIYFLSGLGNFPTLSSSVLGFGLIVTNTLAGILISLRYEAKVISILTIAGGAFAPMYLKSTGDSSSYYLYLWILSVGACYVAHRIRWKQLYYFTFTMVSLLVGSLVIIEGQKAELFTLYHHLFAYLFLGVTLMDGKRWKDRFIGVEIAILSASVAMWLWNMFVTLGGATVALGWIYLANGLAIGGVMVGFGKYMHGAVRRILLLVSGVLLGFAIPCILDQEVMGLFWSIEGMLMVYLGYQFKTKEVRWEGYGLLALAMGKTGWHSVMVVQWWGVPGWHEGHFNYLVFGLVLMLIWVLGSRRANTLANWERQIVFWCGEVLPLWVTSAFFVLSWKALGEWSFALTIIPAIGLVGWKHTFKTKYSHVLGLAYLQVYLIAVLWAVDQGRTWQILDLPLWAQASILLWLLGMWVLKVFVNKLPRINSTIDRFTVAFRELAYLMLSLVGLVLVKQESPDHLVLVLWNSALLLYGIWKVEKHASLKLAVHVWLILAFCQSFVGDQFQVANILVGVGVLLLMTQGEKGWREAALVQSEFKLLLQGFPVLFSALVGLGYYHILDSSVVEALGLFVLVQLGLMLLRNQLALVRTQSSFAMPFMLAWILVAGLVMVLFRASLLGNLYMVVALGMTGWILYKPSPGYTQVGARDWYFSFVLFQVAITLLGGAWLSLYGHEMSHFLISILLVLQAIFMVFVGLRSQLMAMNKVSAVFFGLALVKVVLLDIRHLVMVEKIIVLVIVGLLLLLASYLYVRLRKHYLQAAPEEEHS